MNRLLKLYSSRNVLNTKYYTTIANPILAKYKQQLTQKDTNVWNTYENLRTDKQVISSLEREDFLKLRSNLWKSKSKWGIEDKVLIVLNDMKANGFEWSILEYNEYFTSKLFQAQYHDILTVYSNLKNIKLSIGSFNVILATYILLGKKTEAIEFIEEANRKWNIIPDIRDFDRTMSRCMPKNTILTQTAKELISEFGLTSKTVLNSNLLHLFGEKRINDIKSIMKEQQKQNTPLDITTYNILIKGYADARLTRDAISTYKDMQSNGIKPNHYICSTMLSVFAHTRDIVSAENIVRETVLGGHKPDESLYNQLIKVYFKGRQSQKAFQAFQEVQNDPTLQLNDIILNTMINGLVINKELNIAELLYQKMLESDFKPDMITFNTMLKGHLKLNNIEKAMKIISDMFKYNMEPDTVTFTTLIDSLFITHQPSTANDLEALLKKLNIKPNIYTYNAIINNWIKDLNIKEAENTVDIMKSNRLKPTIHTYTNLIQGYIETQDLNKAMSTFKWLLQQSDMTPDRATFNFMIVGFINHNRLNDAFTCLEQMKTMKLSPTKDTFKLILDQVVYTKDWVIGKKVIDYIQSSGFVIKTDSLLRTFNTVKSHCI